MLELVNVSKLWDGRAVIRELTLSISAGNILCLTGPSGAGKSTVLEIAAGLLSPDGGRRLCKTGRLGFTFQADVLIPWRTVGQNIEFVQDAAEDRSGARRRRDKWLARFGLQDAREQYPLQISGGMRRRLNLARAFSLEPDLLILDEPFAFLDQLWLQRIASYLGEAVANGAAVLMASHQMEPLAGLGIETMLIPGPRQEPAPQEPVRGRSRQTEPALASRNCLSTLNQLHSR